MKKLTYVIILMLSMRLVQAQDHIKAEAYKKDGINYFIKSLPVADYEVLGEKKVTGVGKKTSYTAKMHGAAGLNQVEIAIEEINKGLKKKAKKGTPLQYDGIIVHKLKLVQYIKLENGIKGAGNGPVGADAMSTVETKSGKIIFYMSKPSDPYSVVSEISYNQGGLGETMRGGNQMDVAINGMIDKGLRWVRKGKIDGEFDALLLDYSALRRGKVIGKLIRFN